MRRWLLVLALVGAACVGAAAPAWGMGAAPPDRAALVTRALREALESIVPVASALAPQSEPTGDVSVDYAEGSKALAVLDEAMRCEREGRWGDAARLYQHLIDERPNELCRHGPRLYLPIRAYAVERLAKFPPRGLAEYRLQVDKEAEALWRRASAGQDPAALDTLVSRFPLSSRGDDALAYLASRWTARGEYGRAMRAWRRLVRLGASSDVPATSVAAKVAVCLHQLGRADAARSLLERIGALVEPDDAVRVAGKRTPLDELAARLESLPDASQEHEPVAVRPGRLVWSDSLPTSAAVHRSHVPPSVSLWQDDRVYMPTVDIAPSVADGCMVYPSRTSLISRWLPTGKLRWEWPWAPEQRADNVAPQISMAENTDGRWACTVAEGQVWCPVPMVRLRGRQSPQLDGRMVALDAAGKGAARLLAAADGLAAPLDEGYFACPPVAAGRHLVAAVRVGRRGEEFHLTALRATDGQRLWRTYICGRGPEPTDLRGYHRPAFESLPAVSDGLVVACAGDGVVAAVEADSGRLQWAVAYDQLATRRRRILKRNDAWQDATPRIADGTVYVSPTDSDFLYAIALDSGQLLWRRPREDNRFLVAAHRDCVYVAGTRAACLDAKGEVEWERPLPNAVVGRPVLGGGVLHLPVGGGLVFLDATTGGILHHVTWTDWKDTQPRSFGADISSGDLQLAGEHLVITTPFTLNVFERWRLREAAERRLAQRPKDPAALYAMGLEHQWAGHLEQAAKALETTLEQAASNDPRLSDAQVADTRRRLAMCYEAAARRHEDRRRLDLALQNTLAALHHATQRKAQCRLRLRAARYRQRLRQWEAAVAGYGQVLAEAEPGGLLWGDARDGIRTVLSTAGRAVYAERERAAQEHRARNTADEWRLLLRLYPNSLAAPNALFRLAQLSRNEGDRAAARLAFHRLAREYPRSPNAPAALMELARGYATGGARAMARGVLARLRREYPKWQAPTSPTPQPRAAVPHDEGDTGPEAMLARPPSKAALASLAPLHPPFRIAWQAAPSYGAPELHVVGAAETDAKVLFVLSGASVACRSAADGAVRWADRPGWIGISIADSDRLGGGVVVQTVYGGTPAAEAGLHRGDVIVGFDGGPMRNCAQLIAECSARRAGTRSRLDIVRDGRREAKLLTLGERPTQPEDPQLRPNAWLGQYDGLAFVRRATGVVAFHADKGDRVWSLASAEPDQPNGTASTGTTAAATAGIVVVADSHGRLSGVDSTTGERLWTVHLHEPVVHRMAIAEHGLLVAASRPPTLHVLNPSDGSQLHRVVGRRSLAPPVLALDSHTTVCYAVGATLGRYDLAQRQTLWTTQLANLEAWRLWAAGPLVVVHGADRRGIEVLEARERSTGNPVWSVSLARGEKLAMVALDADAVFGVFRRAGRALVRRLDAKTGRTVWEQPLSRGEAPVAWEVTNGLLALGITVAASQGTRTALLVALDKTTGEAQQRLSLGSGALVQFTRVGPALYAVVEQTLGEQDPREMLFRPTGVRPRFRIARIDGSQ